MQKVCILSDFSKTFTLPGCPTTWSVFAKSGYLGDAYTAERNELYAQNHHFEEAGNIKEVQRWFHEHAELFAKYCLTQAIIDRIVTEDAYFAPREGIAGFLEYVRSRNIPLKIVTSGITNIVEAFFRQRWYGMEWIEIYGNRLSVERGEVIGVDFSTGVVPLDKSTHPFDYQGCDHVFVVGDNREDTTIATGDRVISFGFVDDDRGFDVRLGRESGFSWLLHEIRLRIGDASTL